MAVCSLPLPRYQPPIFVLGHPEGNISHYALGESKFGNRISKAKTEYRKRKPNFASEIELYKAEFRKARLEFWFLTISARSESRMKFHKFERMVIRNFVFRILRVREERRGGHTPLKVREDTERVPVFEIRTLNWV